MRPHPTRGILHLYYIRALWRHSAATDAQLLNAYYAVVNISIAQRKNPTND